MKMNVVGHQGDIGYRIFMFNEHFDIFLNLILRIFSLLEKMRNVDIVNNDLHIRKA